MKIKDGFLLRTLGDTVVVVPVGQAAVDLRGMITLNETGAFLWKALQTEQTPEALCEALCEAYEVDETRAKDDVQRFLQMLDDNGLVE